MSLSSGRSLSSLVTVTLASALVVIGAVAAHATSGAVLAPSVTPSWAPSPTSSSAAPRIEKATAYWFCRATVYRWAFRNPDVDPFTVNSFTKAPIAERGSGWRVVIVGEARTRYGAHSSSDWCDVGGTNAHPRLLGGLMPR